MMSEIFDREDLLENLGGNQGIVDKVVGMFVTDMPRQILDLRKAFLENDPTAVREQAHKLKGAAANLRARSLTKVFAEMEKVASQKDLTAIPSLFEQCTDRFEEFKEVFQGGNGYAGADCR
jgi:two-component system, sensor histidine kinase and response regulator